MSKLTKYHLDRIREAVIADLPKVDYAEQIRVRILGIAVARLPLPVRRIWDSGELRGYLATRHVSAQITPGSYRSQHVPCPDYVGECAVEEEMRHDEVLRELVQKDENQLKKADAADQAMKAAFSSIRTRAGFLAQFPQLAAYLPAESESQLPANLPAATTVMDALQAAGLTIA